MPEHLVNVRMALTRLDIMSNRKILLVEPKYRSKYPPLGLMKIAAYHKELGDEIKFVRGCKSGPGETWDRIYITTMFSFDWKTSLKTIQYYQSRLQGDLFKPNCEIVVGGIAASIMPEQFKKEAGINPISGCLNRPGMLDADNELIVDEQIPDYSILNEVDYGYCYKDAYIGYATRGCIRHCRFCAVPKLEPNYIDYIDIKPWVTGIREKQGEKKDLLLLDNNVLASPSLDKIVEDIKELGFVKGKKLNNKARHVDFNQGMDARLLTRKKMELLADIPINPFRLAYDNIRYRETFEKAIRLAVGMGVRNFSTYMLYNFNDKPADLWDRMHHAVELSAELKVQINPFPMKYIPVNNTDRKYISSGWNRRFLRSMQCILLVTRGIVSARHDFFHRAFGKSHEEFYEILSMPENYIIFRSKHENNGALEWRGLFRELTTSQKEMLLENASIRNRKDIRIKAYEGKLPYRVKELLMYYL